MLLMALLNGCWSKTSSEFDFRAQSNTPLLFSVALAVEMIYFIRNLNLILPHSFLINLVQMFVSGSKTTSMINGKISPGASYPSYKSWLKIQGAEKVSPLFKFHTD